jgi:peptidoglycan L-alanyl-D-glutamate endopeptidase CwlK
MKNANLLNQCDPLLRTLFYQVDKIVQVDIQASTIRTLEQQKEFFDKGVTKTMNSKHLITPENPLSRAVDAGPWPMKWPQENNDKWLDWSRLYYFAGVVISTANSLGIKVRYGGDWNGNFDLKDQNFYDAVHFELME